MDYRYATIDIETTGLNRYKHKITYIGLGLAESVYDDLDKIIVYDMSDPDRVLAFRKACERLRDQKIKCVWQDGKFDTLFIEHHLGIKLPISDDVMLLGTAYDLSTRHGLKAMAKKYLEAEDWDIPTKQKTSLDAEVVIPYLKLDVVYTWELYGYFQERLTEAQRKQYDQILLPAFRMYRDVERTGIHVNLKGLKAVQVKYKELEAERLALLNEHHQINWNSSAQISTALFDEDELPILKKSAKTGKPSADAKVLKRLAGKGFELPRLILDYKAANTLNKMFLNRWNGDLGPDKRIHPSFNLTNVVTGRTSCQNPNLQQVPRSKDVRNLFCAPKGRVFFEADYSQLELRIAADYANDRTMINIYQTGGDIHTETARIMTGGREPTKEERNKAKAVNFGFLYGMFAKKFVDYAYDSYNTVFSMSEAQRFRELFFAKYSRLLPWHKEQEILCEAHGGVSNRFGRFRKLPDIYSSDRYERLSAIRRAINTPVQGTGSDLLICAATQLHREHKKNGLTIVGTIHDSIVGEFWAEDEEWIVPEIKRIMEHPKVMDDFGVTFKVPLEADIGLGPWGSK